MGRKKRIEVCRRCRDAWRETCQGEPKKTIGDGSRLIARVSMCRLVEILDMLHFLSFGFKGDRERENDRGMFLQRVSRMSHECVTRDLWKLENRARSIGIRFRLGHVFFLSFPRFPSEEFLKSSPPRFDKLVTTKCSDLSFHRNHPQAHSRNDSRTHLWVTHVTKWLERNINCE